MYMATYKTFVKYFLKYFIYRVINILLMMDWKCQSFRRNLPSKWEGIRKKIYKTAYRTSYCCPLYFKIMSYLVLVWSHKVLRSYEYTLDMDNITMSISTHPIIIICNHITLIAKELPPLQHVLRMVLVLRIFLV